MLFVYGVLTGIVLTSFVFIFLYKIISKSIESKVQENASAGVYTTLLPFKERMDDYNKSINEFKEKSIEHNAVLKNELKHFFELATKMEFETKELTQALKGDVKAQGDWGELILSRTLEIAGLENGREYTLQGIGLNLKDDEGNLFKPDAIIHLPGNSHLIVDSKVSLKSLREENIKDLKKSLTAHIDGLSKKAYQKLEALNSPDFVIMFVPLEGIMPVIFSEFPDILEYASRKNIIIATPISMLPILKTISSLWRQVKQNDNAVEIASRAGLLYDKFVVLYEGLQATNDIINRLQISHQESLKRLSDGRGNLISKVEELKELGAQASKHLDV